MIKGLEFRNFKSWRETGPIRLAPITALFGTNSSGKTSLLQTLLMLKQTAESSDRGQVLNLGDERTLVELGTFQELLFAHDVNSPLELTLDWVLPHSLKVDDPTRKKGALFESDRLGFSTSVKWRGNGGDGLGRAVVDQMAYRFAGRDFGMKLSVDGKSDYELIDPQPRFGFVRSQGRAWPLPPPAKCYGFPDQVRAYYQNAGFLSDFELQFEEFFARLFYLGPLRDYPRRQYLWAGAQPSDMGRKGERVVDALLAARERGRTISRGSPRPRQTLEERVAQWLKDLGLIESFEVRAITPGGQLFQVMVRRHPKAAEVLITDVGFGVSQILPVIALCYYAPEGSTLILEQPEIHLHPAVQAGLADVFIDAAKRRHIQIILESHSEHLLRRLQRRIAEKTLASSDAALYFCTMEGGESRLTTLDLDMFGNIANWPRDFFGDQFAELAATQEARLRRVAAAD